MGTKGIQTRRRLLDATAALLDSMPLRELTVAQIIRASGVSAATFYVYFPEVSDAVLAVIGEVTQSPPGLLALFAEPWPRRLASERSHEFVATYVENVQRHASLFRVRNVSSDEGDIRFSRLRVSAVLPLIAAIAAMIERRQAKGELPAQLHPSHTAGAVLALIERIAVLWLPSRRDGVSQSTLMHVAAYLTEHLLSDAPSPRRRHVGQRRRRLGLADQPHRADISASPPSTEAPRSNLHGQAMRAKGVQTRRRLVEATDTLLRSRPLRELSVADITQAAGTSTSTFYLYFQDAPEVVLAVIDQAARPPSNLLTTLSTDDLGRFCHDYIDWCRGAAPLLRVRNLAADEGDERFFRARTDALAPMVGLLTNRIALSREQGALPKDLHPASAAIAFVAMAERLAVAPDYGRRQDVTATTSGEVTAYLLSLLTAVAPGAEALH